MGYNTEHIIITLRTKSDNGPRQAADEAEAEYLKREILDLLVDPEVSIVADYQGLE